MRYQLQEIPELGVRTAKGTTTYGMTRDRNMHKRQYKLSGHPCQSCTVIKENHIVSSHICDFGYSQFGTTRGKNLNGGIRAGKMGTDLRGPGLEVEGS